MIGRLECRTKTVGKGMSGDTKVGVSRVAKNEGKWRNVGCLLASCVFHTYVYIFFTYLFLFLYRYRSKPVGTWDSV